MSKQQTPAASPVEVKATTGTGNFVQDNLKSLSFILGAIVVIIAIYFSYQKFVVGPNEVKAADQMHVAQDAWAKKDWDKAIKGDGNYPGFETIVSKYGNTKSGNLANFYLGIAYLNKGEFQKAINSFGNFHSDDVMVTAQALGGTGDAYVELKKYDEAASYFQKAADKASNKFLTPFFLKKLGLVYEAKNSMKDAADAYKEIKAEYPESDEARSIDAYIARVEAKL